jgi:hypothetical protein
MRLLLDSLVALMLTAILGGVVYYSRADSELERNIKLAHSEVRRLQSQIMLQAALESTPLTQRGYPVTVKPEWFHGNVPLNPLLESGHPWLEIAGPAQRDLEHPQRPVATRNDAAQFWYNPYTGDVRARVPAEVADANALSLYNRVNDCHLDSLFQAGR